MRTAKTHFTVHVLVSLIRAFAVHYNALERTVIQYMDSLGHVTKQMHFLMFAGYIIVTTIKIQVAFENSIYIVILMQILTLNKH